MERPRKHTGFAARVRTMTPKHRTPGPTAPPRTASRTPGAAAAAHSSRALSVGVALVAVVATSACSLFGHGQSRTTTRPLSESVADFQAAMALWNAGMCAEAEVRLQSVDPRLLEVPNNQAALDLSRAGCGFFADGELAKSQELALDAARGTTSNAAAGAQLMSAMTHAVCEFDEALNWAFRAEGSRSSWLVSGALATSALIYRHQGRPELAARAATRYLDEFPADWYQSQRSTTPPGLEIDRVEGHQIHSDTRAVLWLLLLDVMGNVDIPPQELEALRTIAAPDWAGGIRRSEAFLQSDAAAQFHVAELDRLRGILAVADVLGLDDDQVTALKAARDRHTEQLSTAGPCAEVATFYRLRGEREASQVNVPDAPNEVDFDFDGLVGQDDLCPHEPETVNGVDDFDGCPDESLAYVERRQIVITEQVLFATDSADVLPASLPLLRQVAQILLTYREITLVRVEGHTDHRGTWDHNISLSTRRAEAVRGQLIALGVDGSRLEAVGYGYGRPLSYGSSDVDMQRNRRVEFLIVGQDARANGPGNGH